MKKRFRVRIEALHNGSINRYFQTAKGVEQCILFALISRSTFRVSLFDRDQVAHYGHVGSLGGMTTARSDAIHIAQRLKSTYIANRYHLADGEWQETIHGKQH